MERCRICDGSIIIRHVDGRLVPIHLDGPCGGRAFVPSADYFLDYRWGFFESYINPNAKCPVCDCDVIFYQSPYGGRVYFDPPIGPPWWKHPCTDSQALVGRPRVRRVSSISRSPTPEVALEAAYRAAWFAAGWRPFVTESAVVRGKHLVFEGYILDPASRRRTTITSDMDATRYFEISPSGIHIGINFLMNSGIVIDALLKGLVMVKEKPENAIEVDIIFMTQTHVLKRFYLE